MIIGFCGLAGAGKSTAALHLVEAAGAQRVRFAGPLKDMMRALGLTDREVDGDLKERPCDLLGGKTPREAMQTIGTEWGRDMISPDLWVGAWSRRAAPLLAEGVSLIVADDVRFLNEAAAIWALGGKVCMVRRPGAGSAVSSGHPSEALRFPWDFEIVNDGDLERLHAQAETLAALLCKKREVAHV